MEQEITHRRTKGGRPKKVNKRSIALTVKCNAAEQILIASKAKQAGITVSEYLRTLGINGKIDRQIKSLPQEVLLFTATLNHLAANVNQIAKKCNSNQQLSTVEKMELEMLPFKIEQLTNEIKNYLK